MRQTVMRRGALLLSGAALVACGGAEPAPPPLVGERAPVEQGDWGESGRSLEASPPGGEDLQLASPTTRRQVTGQLQGALNGISFDHATTDHDYFFVPGHAFLSAAVETPAGAGMVMVDIIGGMEHPIFDSLKQATGSGSTAPGAPPGTEPKAIVYVTSCTGPTLGDWPDEQDAIEFETVAERVSEDPPVVQLVVAGSYPGGSQLTATFRFLER